MSRTKLVDSSGYRKLEFSCMTPSYSNQSEAETAVEPCAPGERLYLWDIFDA